MHLSEIKMLVVVVFCSQLNYYLFSFSAEVAGKSLVCLFWMHFKSDFKERELKREIRPWSIAQSYDSASIVFGGCLNILPYDHWKPQVDICAWLFLRAALSTLIKQRGGDR